MADISANNKRIAKNTLLLYFRMFFTMLVSLYTSWVVLNSLRRRVEKKGDVLQKTCLFSVNCVLLQRGYRIDMSKGSGLFIAQIYLKTKNLN